jgi:hypothetical protein
LGSTFNQKEEHMDGLQDLVSGIGDGVFVFENLMKHAICSGCRFCKLSASFMILVINPRKLKIRPETFNPLSIL